MYFVMLNHPSDYVEAVPLMKDDDHIEFFETKEEADKAAPQTILGDNYGWEVFCLGRGELNAEEQT